MSNTTTMTPYTKLKQPTDHDSRNFGPLIHGYEAQTSTVNQTTVNLTQFVCDLSNKSQVMVYVDGQLLTEGVGNDYVWVAGINNTSSQLTLAVAIPINLNIQLYKIGAPRVNLPTADSINSTINLVQADADKNADQRVLNGAFDTWQEATSFPAIASGVYFADQWIYDKNGTMVHTVSRTTDVDPDGVAQYSALLDCTTAQPSIGAANSVSIRQRIEGNVLRSFKGKNMVLAFRVKATKTGINCVAFRSGTGTRSIVLEYTVLASNTWEWKFVRFNHDTSGTWAYDTNVGMDIRFALAAGTLVQTPTAGVWVNSSDPIATPNQVNNVDSTANDFEISDVMLAEDNTSLNRQPRFKNFNGSLAAEVVMLQRYFISFDGQRLPYLTASVNTTSNSYASVEKTMRVSPSASFNTIIVNDAGAQPTVTAIDTIQADGTGFGFRIVTAATLTIGRAGILRGTAAGSYLRFNARM